MQDTKYEPADIEVYIRGKGLVFREKSLIAYQENDGKILAVGTEAGQIAQQQRDGVAVISPFRRGMIADYHAAVQLLRTVLGRTWGKRHFRRPHIAVCGISPDITEVEKKALEDMMYQLGAGEVTICTCADDYETFSKEMMAHQPKEFAAYEIMIVIAKYEPERYITEALLDVLQYAHRKGIPMERVGELWKEQNGGS